jgi:predicted secreted Zn-dependent protease
MVFGCPRALAHGVDGMQGGMRDQVCLATPKPYSVPMVLCRIRLFVIALAASAAVAAFAPAAPAATPSPRVAHATMHYYAVGGVTEAQIRARLNANAPPSPDGFKGDAYTSWNYHWSWPGYGSSACSLDKAQVTLTVDVHFPRWTHPKAASAAVAAAWNRFATALAVHESGHAAYARARYAFVVRAIKRATCRTADAAARAQLALIRKHDVAYDASTKHGATQGAHFP